MKTLEDIETFLVEQKNVWTAWTPDGQLNMIFYNGKRHAAPSIATIAEVSQGQFMISTTDSRKIIEKDQMESFLDGFLLRQTLLSEWGE